MTHHAANKVDLIGEVMIDISDMNVLETYLVGGKFVRKGDGHEIKYLSGGVSGRVAFVDRKNSAPLIVKQALQKLKTKADWECDPSRMETEAEANDVYYKIVPDSAPKVLYYDKDEYIYVREALPESWRMWKDDLMKGIVDYNLARKSIEALLKVHEMSAGSFEVKEKFSSKEVFDNLRIDPYIRYTVGKYPNLEKKSKDVISLLLDSSIALVHGDYSPKNIMTDGNAISVLDFEVAHCGHPAFDLAFFFNHFILKAVKFDAFGGGYLAAMAYMNDIYMAGCTYMDRYALERDVMKVLPFLLLARVDGKSPVEYLVGDEERMNSVRRIAFSLFSKEIVSLSDVVKIYNDEVKA